MSTDKNTLVLSRDCDAIQIPYGNTITAREGTQVTLVQTLGDTFTVRTHAGYLIRIDNKDADALGLDPITPENVPSSTDTNAPVEETVLWDALKTCYDPEIPVNIVDLGLIYTCTAETLASGGSGVKVTMTLTAPGCGMGQVLKDDVERKLGAIAGVKHIEVELVFQPPWDSSMMTEAARLQLGMM